ncbi:hypothetical protein D3C81_1408140 [compost metagenome]
MEWWDVQAGQARTATLPDLQLQIAQGAGGIAAPPLAQPAQTAAAVPNEALTLAGSATARPWLWPALAAGFALLWLATLIWGLSRRAASAHQGERDVPRNTETPSSRYSHADLRRALDSGGLDEVVHILAAMGGVDDLDAVMLKLDDESQRQALERMQRARWAGEGDVAAARARLREVFRQGPTWRGRAVAEKPVLDPLYPG